MPQLTVTQNAIPGQPGMAFDAEASSRDVVSVVAAVNIPFGVLCELTATGLAQPVQDASTLSGTVTVTNGSASITFSANQTLPAGQLITFSDQPSVPYRLAAAIANTTGGTLDRLYSGTGGAGKTASLGFNPQLAGISLFDPLGVEQNYVQWAVPTVLSGTVSVVNGSTLALFSTTQSLAQGTPVAFSSQPGVEYFVAQATSSSNQAQLTVAYAGTTNGSATTTLPGQGSTTTGWKAGTSVPFMRRGRIWVAGDASGAAVQYGPVNVHHSSTGANAQGVFTFIAAPVLTVGNEIDVAPGCTVWNPGLGYSNTYTDPFGNVFSMYVVEINV